MAQATTLGKATARGPTVWATVTGIPRGRESTSRTRERMAVAADRPPAPPSSECAWRMILFAHPERLPPDAQVVPTVA